jgi:signal transduction histidine kinase
LRNTEKNEKKIVTGTVDLNATKVWKKTIEAWQKQEILSYILEGEELAEYYQELTKAGFRLPPKVLKATVSMSKQYHYDVTIPQGGLYVFSETPVSDKDLNIIKRFADVYNLTYTRYEDLQKAEIRALEAVRQASLDRVRGEIASMRSKEDLSRITPLIWKELKALGVPFIRCGVFIMDVENEIIQSYLSTPDGKTLGIFNLPFTSELIGELMVDFWEKGKIYKDHWTKKQFVEFMQRLKDTGQLQDTSTFQGAAAPPESLDLHFIPFKQGMLYVGNTTPLTKDELQLVRSLAETFSIAYARYEDFRELEAAKEQIEETLDELKSAQSQLVHSEKMASLGELTAGIAHEIQNPLNFVNNFSEVSEDLIDEMLEDLLEGNDQEVNEIITNLRQNLQKINHHGKRASSIVKGMLQHSRASQTSKEVTDINALVDEYLRLAYHGMRAKDKSFNVEYKLDLDPSLPEIAVIPQEIGRVLLNMINNAFYAVSASAREVNKAEIRENSYKHQAAKDNDYKPEVIVSTKKLDGKIEIQVKDNGNGIPDIIKDKIFQPFFTTKPTGQGTGLGLSLSYDIITKGHGGNIEVDSKMGQKTQFIITLPINPI